MLLRRGRLSLSPSFLSVKLACSECQHLVIASVALPDRPVRYPGLPEKIGDHWIERCTYTFEINSSPDYGDTPSWSRLAVLITTFPKAKIWQNPDLVVFLPKIGQD